MGRGDPSDDAATAADVQATNAEDALSRPARFDFSVAFGDERDADPKRELIADAEHIGAIGDTLRSDPPVAMSHRAETSV